MFFCITLLLYAPAGHGSHGSGEQAKCSQSYSWQILLPLRSHFDVQSSPWKSCSIPDSLSQRIIRQFCFLNLLRLNWLSKNDGVRQKGTESKLLCSPCWKDLPLYLLRGNRLCSECKQQYWRTFCFCRWFVKCYLSDYNQPFTFVMQELC